MSDNNENLGASSRFGTELQKQVTNEQRRANSAESGTVHRSTIVVLTTLNSNEKYSYMSADEQLHEKPIIGKIIDRLPALIERAAGPSADKNSAYYLLHPTNGVPTSIDERVKFGDSFAAVVSYTVNKAVSEMHGTLSLALFAAVDSSDLSDLAAEFGIHAIAIVPADNSGVFIKALTEQLEALQSVNVLSIDDTDGTLDREVIDYAALPGNPVTVVSGAVRTFITQSIGGEVIAAIPNNGEFNVKQNTINPAPVDLEEDFDNEDEVEDQQEDGEESPASGAELFGFKSETLTTEQMTEALEAVGYDCSEFAEDELRVSFETEQALYLSKEDAAEEESDEEESDDEEEEAEEEFDPCASLAQLLAEESFDRRALKVLVLSQELKVFKSDTEETLTAKLLENVEDATQQELFELVSTFVELLGEREIECPALTAAISSDDEDDSGDDSDEEESEEEDDEEEESEDDSEEAPVSDLTAVTDPLDYFQFAGGELEHHHRLAAVEAMGENVEGLNIIQVMKAFNRIQQQTNAIEITGLSINADADDAEDAGLEDQIRAILEANESGDDDDTAIEDLWTLLDCASDDQDSTMIDDIVASGTEESHANALQSAAETYGVDISEMSYEEGLLAFLAEFFSEGDAEEESEEEAEEESDEEAEEADDREGYEADTAENASSLLFLKDIDKSNPIGPMLSVDMAQALIVNFTLTDGRTYTDIEAELNDVNDVNYRIPFNVGAADKAAGSMHVPAGIIVDVIQRAGTSRFLADPKTFDVGSWAESLEQTLDAEIQNSIYEGRIPDGADPQEAGVVVGDFIDEDELEEAAELGIDPSQFDEMGTGDHLPIASLYNAHTRVRPVNDGDNYIVAHTTVLNVALPGFWGAESAEIVGRMIQAAVNRVISSIADRTDVKVYAAFTLEAAALLNNSNLFAAMSVLRDMERVQAYSAADAAAFTETDDVIETASALDDRDLPFTVLTSGIAQATFENGGDLTVLVPCFEEEAEYEDEAEDDGDDE